MRFWSLTVLPLSVLGCSMAGGQDSAVSRTSAAERTSDAIAGERLFCGHAITVVTFGASTTGTAT